MARSGSPYCCSKLLSIYVRHPPRVPTGRESRRRQREYPRAPSREGEGAVPDDRVWQIQLLVLLQQVGEIMWDVDVVNFS
eukprot:scaffold14529_cov117-Isochrysis_galbana.AAC.12